MGWLSQAAEKAEKTIEDVTGHARRDLERQLKSVHLVHSGVIAHAEALVPVIEDTLKVVDPSISAPVLAAVNAFIEFAAAALQVEATAAQTPAAPAASAKTGTAAPASPGA